jgi:hypothetical protein
MASGRNTPAVAALLTAVAVALAALAVRENIYLVIVGAVILLACMVYLGAFVASKSFRTSEQARAIHTIGRGFSRIAALQAVSALALVVTVAAAWIATAEDWGLVATLLTVGPLLLLSLAVLVTTARRRAGEDS